ncbi:MAG: peroxidase-related enzyme [Beutenbergiaceae bacterium]
MSVQTLGSALVRESVDVMSAPSYFPVPEFNDLPADIQEIFTEIQEQAGFIPNALFTFAHRPDELRAMLALNAALFEKETGLSTAERELIAVATSAANGCLYCVISHGALYRVESGNPVVADQVTINPVKAELSERERLIVDFALQVSLDSKSVSQGTIDDLRTAGLSDDEIWDIGAITGLFAYSNRLANVTGARPNSEYYALGR